MSPTIYSELFTYSLYTSTTCMKSSFLGGEGKTLLYKVSRKQNNCFSLCSGALLAEGSNMYSVSRLLPFDEIYKYFTRIKFFCYYKLNRNMFFTNTIRDHECSHSHQPRFSANAKLNTSSYRLSICQFSFLHKAVQCWNEVSHKLRDITSVHKSKAQLRTFYYMSTHS